MKYLIIFLLGLVFNLSLYGNDRIEALLNKYYETYDENPNESIQYCFEADKIAKSEGITEYNGEISNCKARYYLLITKFDLCALELNKAIEFHKTEGTEAGLIVSYSLKGNLLGKLGEESASHAMLLKVIALERKNEIWGNLTNSLNNLTLDYHDDLDSMLIILKELESLQEYFSDGRYYFYYQNWGYYYMKSEKYDLATNQFFQALKVASDLKMTDSKATILMILARNYRYYGQLGVSEKFALESYEFSKKNHLIFEESEALTELVLTLEAQNKYKEAFEYNRLLSDAEKKIYDIQKIQKVEQIEGQLKLAEKEKQILLGESELKAEKLESAEQKTRMLWMWAIIIGVVLLLSFTIFIVIKTKKLNTTIQLQKEEVELKSYNLEEALSNIEDSLEYSKLIQNAMLPPLDTFDEVFSDSFVMYLPKDIVSGDFYWIHKTENKLIFAVGDCTGHGVPGAMVSMVCHEAMNKVIKEHHILSPNKVLDEVKELISATFKKNQNLNDGMDMSLCSLSLDQNKSTQQLEYAGAHNPIWIIRKGNAEAEVLESSDKIKIIPFDGSGYYLIEVKADKQPIGRFEKTQPFTLHKLELKKNDTLYLFSDGFADQFGGDKGKKFKTANFKKLLVSIQDKSMKEQQQVIHETFDKWKSWPNALGEAQVFEQIDDVCVIGVRL